MENSCSVRTHDIMSLAQAQWIENTVSFAGIKTALDGVSRSQPLNIRPVFIQVYKAFI